MTMPNFYILGAQKCGTTWLAAMLRQHPEVFIPLAKEVNFFNRPGNFARGQAWYEQYFAASGHARAIGDATPQYLAVDVAKDGMKVIERIGEATPDARFIVSLRDPVSRAISGMLHDVRAGRLSPRVNFDDVFDRMFRDPESYPSVLKFGNYLMHVRAWLAAFPAERFRFLVYEEDIVNNKAATLRGCCEFLGIASDYSFRDIDTPEHATVKTRLGLVLSSVPPRIVAKRLALYAERLGMGERVEVSPDTIRRLYDHYQPDWDELGKAIGRDLSAWRRSFEASPRTGAM
jgi:hypothetical protein